MKKFPNIPKPPPPPPVEETALPDVPPPKEKIAEKEIFVEKKQKNVKITEPPIQNNNSDSPCNTNNISNPTPNSVPKVKKALSEKQQAHLARIRQKSLEARARKAQISRGMPESVQEPIQTKSAAPRQNTQIQEQEMEEDELPENEIINEPPAFKKSQPKQGGQRGNVPPYQQPIQHAPPQQYPQYPQYPYPYPPQYQQHLSKDDISSIVRSTMQDTLKEYGDVQRARREIEIEKRRIETDKQQALLNQRNMAQNLLINKRRR